MAQSVDVGSILGGRYKITARVLATAEQDVVLDGIDQVLSRPVSILVAGPDNGDHLSQGAREVATGERQANLQILDLGNSDGTTYLISNKSSAAELLDLVVPTAPFEEPFFTDTLGNEIFGMPRPELPQESDSYDYVYEDQPRDRDPEPERGGGPARKGRESGSTELSAAKKASKQASKPTMPPGVVPPAAAAARNPGAAAQSAAENRGEPQSSESSGGAPTPKVTLWSDDDYGFINEERSRGAAAAAPPAAALAATGRKASNFPASARAASIGFDDGGDDGDDGNGFEDDDEENNPKAGGRWLVGAVVAVIIVAALIFAVSNISTLFGPSPVAGPASTSSSAAAQPTDTAPASKPATNGASTPPPTAAVAPVIASVTRLVPDAPNMGSEYDGKLPTTVDGNPGTFWQTLEYSNDSFAGLTSSVNLVVGLVAPADIKTVTISQLGGSGGSFRLLTNNQPTLDGAKEIGTGSFTSTDITLTAPQGTKAQYVIISFTQLPKQQSFQTYPYAVKIAGIGIK
ncbi:ABC transporter substrate-binding protein [Paenarthrobacter sp. Z7-10]|uniref:ABC transporter substrate-binding protein n=1 Tax=Paenarthrobacter sp. Z7-10 TaxID=2787635 RepID=UPI0022A99115|nr:ABC transporter substrate-binding protein [Paenarthrobacter sp. Z7-10]MCZ2401720.1 ABC transporter substrate-binding protein [Paenarthrobacter sp. Z7-10]